LRRTSRDAVGIRAASSSAASGSCTVVCMAAVDIVVVGAGVVGLTTAISLAEAGLSTRVVAAEPPSLVTSAAAGAIWGPVRCGPDDRCRAWARTGLEVLGALADEPSAGVHQLHGRVVARTVQAPPKWADLLPDLRLLAAAELPSGLSSGWSYTAPAVSMPVYLEYLLNRYASLGGGVGYAAVPSLASVDAPVVVNCTGIGARSLVPDESLVPVRGQVVVAENPGISEFYIDHGADGATDYVYAFPHGDVVILGGTAEEGAFDWAPRPEVSARIMRDCAAAFPALRGARVLTERVGLRPCRPEVRLESEPLPGGRTLWHNYGHGGAGVTLSWGCAREITTAVLGAETPGGSLPWLPVGVACIVNRLA
jgi:D-amino-acid oxidase